MAGRVMYVNNKTEKWQLVTDMESAGYWLASTKGRTVSGENLLMLTFYENGLKTTVSKVETP